MLFFVFRTRGFPKCCSSGPIETIATGNTSGRSTRSTPPPSCSRSPSPRSSSSVRAPAPPAAAATSGGCRSIGSFN